VVKRLQRASKVKEELRVVSMIDDTGMQSVSESCFWPLPAGQSPSDAEAQSSSRFVPVENVQSADSTSTDVMTSLVPLLVRGRTQLLHINNNDDDCAENTPRSRKDLNFEDVEILARETGVELPKDYKLWKNDVDCQRAGDWRFACPPDTPGRIGS
jgi:hypothetical protein